MTGSWRELVSTHRGRLLGLMVGLGISLLMITLGFLKTFFVVVCAAVGYYIGRRLDHRESLGEILERLLPPKGR